MSHMSNSSKRLAVGEAKIMIERFWTNLKNLFYFLVILAMIPLLVLLVGVAVIFVFFGVLDRLIDPLGPTA